MRGWSALHAGCVIGLASTLAGCQTLDARAVAETHRLESAPYYVDLARPSPPPGSCAVVLPVTLDPRLVGSFDYRDRRDDFAPLVDALNARLSARSGCVRGVQAGPGAARAPRVYVGIADGDDAPTEAALQRTEADRFSPMVLHLERPDEAWRRAAAGLLAQSNAPYAISIHLGVSQYSKGYSSPLRKEVGLGTGHRQPIRFLTAEDKPVEVLHLTGVLVDGSGRPVRAGAEGIVARDTPFLAQTIDVSRLLDREEILAVLNTQRRTDLPGAPLKMDVALDNLLAQLTRGEPRVPAR